MSAISPTPITILSGQSLSNAIPTSGVALCAIELPAEWDTANLTLQFSSDGTNFKNVYDDYGNEIVLTAAATRYIQLRASLLIAPRYLKLRSGTSATPVNQTANRILTLMLLPL